MSVSDIVLDRYNRRARLAPTLIVLLPVCLGIGSWLPLDSQIVGSLAGVGGTLAFGILLTILGRGPGKAKEPALFEQWCGKPTTLMLSYRHTSLNEHTLERHHDCLRKLLPALSIPESKEEELADPKAADTVYDSCVDHLREATRDKTRFHLVFEENMNYGFCRNLWGMRAAGIVSSLLGAAASVVRAGVEWYRVDELNASAIVYAVISLVLFVLFLIRFNIDWVRAAADGYSRQLLASCEKLAPD